MANLLNISVSKKIRCFSYWEHDNQINMQAWEKALKGLEDGDAGLLMEGWITGSASNCSLRLLNNKERPTRNPLITVVNRLLKDPAVKQRAMDIEKRVKKSHYYFSDDGTGEPKVHDIHLISIALAKDPGLLANAVELWRKREQESGKWWSHPMVMRIWEGRPELIQPIKALFAEEHQKRAAEGLSEPLTDLERILLESGKGALLQFGGEHGRARERRLKKEEPYGRGGSEWGVDWLKNIHVEGVDGLSEKGLELLCKGARDLIVEAAEEWKRAQREERANSASGGAKSDAATGTTDEMVITKMDSAACEKKLRELGANLLMLGVELHMPGLVDGVIKEWSKANDGSLPALPFKPGDWCGTEKLLPILERHEQLLGTHRLGEWLTKEASEWEDMIQMTYQGTWEKKVGPSYYRRYDKPENYKSLYLIDHLALCGKPWAADIARSAIEKGGRLSPELMEFVGELEVNPKIWRPREGDFKEGELAKRLALARACELVQAIQIQKESAGLDQETKLGGAVSSLDTEGKGKQLRI